MLFTDWKVLLGIALLWLIYYLPLVRNFQVAALVVASLAIYFYEAPTMLSVLLCSVVLNAGVSYIVFWSRSSRRRLAAAFGGVALNLVTLAFFKYSHVLYGAVKSEAGWGEGDFTKILFTFPLPIGISFYTFHGISLLVDTYREHKNACDSAPETRPRPPSQAATVSLAERSLSNHVRDTFLYLCFFPQLVAGPITRANFFYPQIRPKSVRDIDWARAIDALIMGYFLKIVIANNLGARTFLIAHPYFLLISRDDLLLLLLGYAVQIFSDFAGYSLIAIGLGLLFGYRLPDNFNFPYIAQSFAEFWTRWHISLSSWLKEYLYIPLGGSHRGTARTFFNLLVVMVLGGLWHGAGLSYAAWGLWHGAALVAERPFLKTRFYRSTNALAAVVRGLIVFVVVTLGWLLFKLPEFDHVLGYLRAIWTSSWARALSPIGTALLVLCLPVAAYHAAYLMRRAGWHVACLRQPVNGVMLALIALTPGPNSPFIYFQF